MNADGEKILVHFGTGLVNCHPISEENLVANTFTSLHYHVIFSTKHREPWIKRSLEERLWAYLGGIANQDGMRPLLIGGMEDHVHLLLGVPPTLAISHALKQLKGGSSGWIKDNLPGCRSFGWQDGYGASR